MDEKDENDFEEKEEDDNQNSNFIPSPEKNEIKNEEEDNNQNSNFISSPEKNEIKNEEEDNNNVDEIKESNSDNIINNENKENSESSSLNKISKIYIDKTSELNGKTIYHIKGDFLNKYQEIVRRYRDFYLLRFKLSQNWPGIIIPPIAQKKYFGSLDPQTVNERIYQLENFLKISTKSEYLMQTEELKTFLNAEISNSDDFQVEIKKLKPYTLKQISDNYTKYFGHYKNLEKEYFGEEQINVCIEFINGFILKLNKYKEQLVEFGEVKKTRIYREYRITSYFTDFEKYCVLDYVNNDLSSLFFFNGNSSFFENQNKYKALIKNPYLILSCWLRLKELELNSIKNNISEYKTILAKRTTMQNKAKELTQKLKDVEEGRISFLDKIMLKGDPQILKEKYKAELEIQNNEVEYINNISIVLNDYLAIEIYKYFDDLKMSFYDVVKKFATVQNENCTLASNLWLKVKCKKREQNENDELNDIMDNLDENIENNDDNNKIEESQTFKDKDENDFNN